MIRLSLDSVAAKLQWLRSQGQAEADALIATPRYVEALCFIQAMTQRPGGLGKFAEELLGASTKWVKSLPARKVWDGCHSDAVGADKNSVTSEDFEHWLKAWCVDQNADFVGDFLYDRFNVRFPEFLGQISSFMDGFAAAEFSKTGDTSLRRKVVAELDFARGASPPVPMTFIADTRHGKTTAIGTYCRAWPGRARLVTVPESNHEREFYAAYADAFGLDYTPGTQTKVLKDRVQFTLRNTGLFTIHDEAHFLVPIRYEKDTPPQRLNWVRTQIIDRHIPCAFFCTPQSQEETLKRYAAKTRYNMEQWMGRMPKPVLIEDSPNYDDLLAVVRANFPEFSKAVVDELCDVADEEIGSVTNRIDGVSGFKVIDQAGARARFLAGQRGSQTVSVEDVRAALDWLGVASSAVTAHPAGPKLGKVPCAAPARHNLRGVDAKGPQSPRSGIAHFAHFAKEEEK
jgi:hypothetical protein